MAKKQSRRTISLSRKTFERLKIVCGHHAVSMAGVVEELVKRWLEVGTVAEGRVVVPDDVVIKLNGTRAPSLEHLNRQQLAQRVALEQCRIQDALRRQREYEQAALSNPCRRERCGIVGLHPAHEGRA